MVDPNAKLTPCRFKVPLAYNDESPVEPDRMDDIKTRLWVAFGYYTIEGTEQGAYTRRDTGKKQVEYLLKICVAVEGEQEIDRLRTFVSEVGEELGQETMYFEVCGGSVVELVPSSKKGDR